MSDIEKDKIEYSRDTIRPLETRPTLPSFKHRLVKLPANEHIVVIQDIAGIQSFTATNGNNQVTSQFNHSQISSSSLYASIISKRRSSQFRFKALAAFYNIALVIQLFFGAALTALSSSSSRLQIATIILAAANTINAGLLALMHNSGLPERVKNDFREYEKVELHVKALMETGIVRDGWTKEEVIVDCWDRFARAKEVVGKNKPASYKGSEEKKAMKGPDRVV